MGVLAALTFKLTPNRHPLKERGIVNTKRHFATAYVLGMALLALMGCSRSPEPSPYPPSLTKEQAAQRTVAPLTRPIALDKAGEIANVEFDLPPPGPNAMSDLALGFRLQAGDLAAMRQLDEKLDYSRMAAHVTLQRVVDGAVTDVALVRVTKDLSSTIPISADGHVPGAISLGPSRSELGIAGLLDESLIDAHYTFALYERAEPGHYRLKIELDDSRPVLAGAPAQLLVGYVNKGK